jgi:hypothetical protein
VDRLLVAPVAASDVDMDRDEACCADPDTFARLLQPKREVRCEMPMAGLYISSDLGRSEHHILLQ